MVLEHRKYAAAQCAGFAAAGSLERDSAVSA